MGIFLILALSQTTIKSDQTRLSENLAKIGCGLHVLRMQKQPPRMTSCCLQPDDQTDRLIHSVASRIAADLFGHEDLLAVLNAELSN